MLSGFVILLIIMAIVFDFINGFHDAANSIATAVYTRVLKPSQAVVWAALFNFIAFLFFETKVANTIGKGIIDPSIVDPMLIFSVLVGAIFWNIVTWYYGIPSSSSHALVGGLLGAGIAKAGFNVVQLHGLFTVVLSIVASPLLGMLLGNLLMRLSQRMLARCSPFGIDRVFRKLQLFSACLYSLGHGGNDAQKTMGLIAVLLYSSGYLGETFYVPFWVVLICQLAMGLGTLFGGWRIIKTLGHKLTKLKPIGGFCAETAGASTLFLATALGVPVSTTHTITGAIVGVGSVRGSQGVRWGQTRQIVMAWVITMPAAALVSSIMFIICEAVHAYYVGCTGS